MAILINVSSGKLIAVIETPGGGGGDTSGLPKQLIADGDSITIFGGSNAYSNQAAAILGSGYVLTNNFAVSGQTSSEMLGRAAANVVPAKNHSLYSRTIITVLIGRNDMGLHLIGRVGILLNNLKTYIETVGDSLTDVYLMTILASNNATFYGTNLLTQNQNVYRTNRANKLISDNFAAYGAAGCINLAKDASFQLPINHTYIGNDDVHPTAAGNTKIAQIEAAYFSSGTQPAGTMQENAEASCTFSANSTSDIAELVEAAGEWLIKSGNTVVLDQHRASGNCSFIWEHTEGYTLSGMFIGFDSNATPNAYANWKTVVNFNSDILNISENGGSFVNTGISAVRPATYKLSIESNVIKLYHIIDDGWILDYTFATEISGAAYLKIKSDFPNNSLILYPRGEGLS